MKNLDREAIRIKRSQKHLVWGTPKVVGKTSQTKSQLGWDFDTELIEIDEKTGKDESDIPL